MILFTLIIGAVLFVIFVLMSGDKWFSKHKWINGFLVALSLIVLIGSECLIVLNDYQHFGMKNVVQSQKVKIYSTVPQTAGQPSAVPFLLLHQDVGKDKLYIYNISETNKTKMKHTAITDQSQIRTTDQSPYLSVRKTKRVYANAFYRNLFALSGNNDVLVSTQNVFYLPKNRLVLSTAQAKKMQQQMKQKQQAMKKAAGRTLRQ
ncbi:DUF4811 domain-containing protein [Sporolactobacillus sp. KGMB 08714]|uniref:DUF4811 domain-containing protein n=1 Tax=Sporolactobacillus sp. KGMB 08714 TaxID=3064704 RepID=UPI002FBE5304